MASSFPQPDEIYFNLNNAQRKESPHCESGAKHFWHPHSLCSQFIIDTLLNLFFIHSPTDGCQRKQPQSTGQQSLPCDLQVGLFVLMRAAFT